jgi:hypothetical protein
MIQKTNSLADASSKAQAEPLETLDAVVLYDTIATGKRGLSVLAGLTGILEIDLVETRPRLWRIDLLQDPGAAEYAADDVSTAHVIVVSTSGQAPLPLVFKSWFTTILQQRQSKGENVAVIALLGLDELTSRAASPDFHFIKQETLEARLDFFAPEFDAPYPVKSGSSSEPVAPSCPRESGE